MTDRPTSHRRRLVACLVGMALLAACSGDGAAVEELGAAAAVDLLTSSTDDLVVIDVRTPAEFGEGRIEDAANLDLEGGVFTATLDALDPDARYLLYCATGNRSGQAAELMAEAGFTMVYDAGGYTDLVDAGAPVDT